VRNLEHWLNSGYTMVISGLKKVDIQRMARNRGPHARAVPQARLSGGIDRGAPPRQHRAARGEAQCRGRAIKRLRYVPQ
jgi:hypothetical protein